VGQAYCVKCREKRDVAEAQAVTLTNGKAATRGVCAVCGTPVFKIGAP
jgi:hypothetical protein